MADLVSVEALRRQARLAPSDASQDEDLVDCLAAAVTLFEGYTHRQLVESVDEESPDNALAMDGGVRRALLLAVAHFFEHRGDANTPIPDAFWRLADPNRWRDL